MSNWGSITTMEGSGSEKGPTERHDNGIEMKTHGKWLINLWGFKVAYI